MLERTYFKFYTGTLGEMKKISFTPLLSLVWGQHGYQTKRNSSGNSIFFSLVHCFSAKIEQTSKNHWKMAVFQCFWPILSVFWSLLNFDWKTVHQTKRFKFCDKLCFYYYVCCPQTRDNSGVNEIFFISPCVKRILLKVSFFLFKSLVLAQ